LQVWIDIASMEKLFNKFIIGVREVIGTNETRCVDLQMRVPVECPFEIDDLSKVSCLLDLAISTCLQNRSTARQSSTNTPINRYIIICLNSTFP